MRGRSHVRQRCAVREALVPPQRRPNAAIRHVVERGSLHLYLVAAHDIIQVLLMRGAGLSIINVVDFCEGDTSICF